MESSDDEGPPSLVPADNLMEPQTRIGKATEEAPAAAAAGAVPVTIVTGFLGSGKTTLLNYILTQDHGRRIAVIENEVGDSMDIESLIARDGADGTVLADNLFELKNGCICCTVKDDLVSTLETLLERRNKFDYVIIETTGLANPGPVASVFWLDDALESALRLDSIVTLVDAKNFARQLKRVPEDVDGGGDGSPGEEQEEGQPAERRPQNEAAMQVAYADRVLVNKSDLVSTGTLDDVVAQVRTINAVAEVRCTKRSAVDLAWILDTKCFSPELALAVDPTIAQSSRRPSSANTDDIDRRKNGDSGSSSLDNVGTAPEGVDESDHDRIHRAASSAGAGGAGADGAVPVNTGDDGQQSRHQEHSHKHVDGEACADCASSSVEGPGGQACSVHDPSVTTCAVDLPGSLDLSRLERWLGGLLWDPPPGGTEVYRVKGVVSVEGRRERFVVQGVADLFEVAPAGVVGSAWLEGEARRCKVVFIGRLLSKEDLTRGVRSCMTEG